MPAELTGPRLDPEAAPAKRLVVFLHGYGADGNDLIELGRQWRKLLPDAAFVSPHAPERCAGAPTGRQWFRAQRPRARRRRAAGTSAGAASLRRGRRSTPFSTPNWRGSASTIRAWLWSASARDR